MIKANEKYIGEITGGAWTRSQKNTPGFQVNMKCAEGTAFFTIWLTDKTKEKAKKYFDMLGVSESQMKNSYFLNNTLPTMVVGQEVEFGTALDEYQEKSAVKVIWIGKPKPQPTGDPAQEAANFFNNVVVDMPDDDIPF